MKLHLLIQAIVPLIAVGVSLETVTSQELDETSEISDDGQYPVNARENVPTLTEGAEFSPTSLQVTRAATAESTIGLRITELGRGNFLSTSGLQVSDVITEVDGVQIGSKQELDARLMHANGQFRQSVVLRVFRSDRSFYVVVKLSP